MNLHTTKYNFIYILYYSYFNKNYNKEVSYKLNILRYLIIIYLNGFIFRYNKNIKYNFFKLKKKNYIIKFKNFYLRCELITFISLYNYLNYFKLHKYFQYLYNNKYLYKYLLLYNLLYLNNKCLKNTFYSNIAINNNFQIYNKTFFIIKPSLEKRINLNLCKFYKFENYKLILISPNSFLTKSIIYFFYYKTLNLIKFKVFNIKTLRITSIKKLFFLLYNIYFIFFEVKKIIFWNNIINKNLITYKKRINIPNFFKIIINLIKLVYIDLLFFKFFNELNILKLNSKIKKLWVKSWLILKRNCIFKWHFIKETNVFNEIIIWKIFYFNKISNNNIIKQINIQKIENNKKTWFLNLYNLLNYISLKNTKFSKINLLFYEIFINLINSNFINLKKEKIIYYNLYYINYNKYSKHNNNIILIFLLFFVFK